MSSSFPAEVATALSPNAACPYCTDAVDLTEVSSTDFHVFPDFRCAPWRDSGASMNSDDSIQFGDDACPRCWWCADHADYRKYHDDEWGHPVADDRVLFEKVCLEGFQSGLSWLTILRKRENFRAAFDDFDFHRVARYSEKRILKLLNNAGIIRHEGKIRAAVNNACRAVEMESEFGSLAAWFWQFEPPVGRPPFSDKAAACLHTTCPEAVELSKQLRKRGWKFFGPTTAYAFMQAMGMVNDHLVDCHRHSKVEAMRSKFRRPGIG